MMTPIAKFMFVAMFVVAAIVGAVVAIAFDSKVAEASSHYLVKGNDSALVKHSDVAEYRGMDIPFVSDAAEYAKQDTTSTSFGTFLFNVVKAILPVSLPGTSAPHGTVTCTIGTGVNQTTVTTNDCSSL